MVDPALQSAIEAMSLAERLKLVEYIESTVESAPFEVTEEHKALIRSRAADLGADPSIGCPGTSGRPDALSLEVTRRRLVYHRKVEAGLDAVVAHYASLDPVLPGR